MTLRSRRTLPALDRLVTLIAAERPRGFRFIVVDEAQDLSPMQLRVITRRSLNGAMTLLGDIAQSTGPYARDSWDDVLEYLPKDLPHEIRELRYGYRVPREVFDVAARLLPAAAPGVKPPEVVRSVGVNPNFLRAEDHQLGATAVSEAMDYSSRGLSVGIVCPDNHRSALERALESNGVNWQDAGKEALSSSINVVRPVDAKGLEFDAVVVVEPADIILEVERGHRLLYVALTRSTKRLSVVHSTDEAIPLGPLSAAPTREAAVPTFPAGSESSASGTAAPTSIGRMDQRNRLVSTVAQQLADDIRGAIHPDQWSAVLDAIARQLSEDDQADPEPS